MHFAVSGPYTRGMSRVAEGFRGWARVLAGLGILGTAGADRVLDTAQDRVFRVAWFFLPEPEIARDLRFQHLLASRFLSEAGQQAITFGALVAVARDGGSGLEVALIGVAAILPPALFGLYGGSIADALPKRTALAGAYAIQAVLCFLVPLILGTDFWVMVVLLFSVNTLAQVSSPTESSVLPLVATEAELASAAAFINLFAAAGQAIGTAVLAPWLVRGAGVEAVFAVAGVLLILSASRVFDLPVEEKVRRFAPKVARPRAVVRWLVRHPAVGTMVILSVLAGMVGLILQILAPLYVAQVLETDAANTAYVFALTALGIVVALVIAPRLMDRWGERAVAMAGLLFAAGSLFLLGIPDDVGQVLDPVNPIRIAGPLGVDLSRSLRTAALLAAPLSFGVSLTATSVQTYLNRRVPVGYQGRMFGMQNALRNGAAILPLITLGFLAEEVGADTVLLVSPFLLLATGYGLVWASYRFAGIASPAHLQVAASFWEEPERKSSGQE